MKIYVDELPNNIDECPFYSKSDKVCSIINGTCCLDNGMDCEHLIAFTFDIEEVGESVEL